jgi:hypothetical protein
LQNGLNYNARKASVLIARDFTPLGAIEAAGALGA